ncbi:protein UL19 [Panine betaherpesvirus 2]|uniref:Protein UL19 n=1 Tax=Panine betaherpesvirus 2 TaxID=188763 RepID=Q8QS69_9BETA|nr:protein UL19 [Panine betaherpesvirus 2]AAM00669.1 protein UL19 [Panine betaherpesvirus 2]QXV67771.1 protein UL19 [Panine betaherpesvirus 2]
MTSNALYELFRRRLPRAPVNTVMFLTRRTRDGPCGRLTSVARDTHRTMYVLDHGFVRIERSRDGDQDCTSFVDSLKRCRLRNSHLTLDKEPDVTPRDVAIRA